MDLSKHSFRATCTALLPGCIANAHAYWVEEFRDTWIRWYVACGANICVFDGKSIVLEGIALVVESRGEFQLVVSGGHTERLWSSCPRLFFLALMQFSVITIDLKGDNV